MVALDLTLATRYLWGRKLRTFLTTLAITFGTLVIFSMNLVLPTMLKAFQSNMMAASGQVDITVTHNSGESFASKIIKEVRRVQGVRAISGSLNRTVNIPEGYYGKTIIAALTLSGIDPRDAQTLRNFPIKEGRFLRPDDNAVAVISTSLADDLGIKVDDKFQIPTTVGNVSLRIVGLLPARTLPGNEEILVSLQEAQKLLDLPDRVNTIEINLDTTDQAQRDAIQNQIENILGDEFSIGGLSSGAELLASIRTGKAAFNLFGFLSLFMGGFIIFNTFRTIVAERRHDIGMLRAIGASRSTILRLILTEGIFQGIAGTLVGITLGYLMGAGLLSMMSSMLSQYMNLQMGAPVIKPSLLLSTVGLGVGVTLFAGILPAFNASKVTPLEALRPSNLEGVYRIARVSTVIGAVLIVSAVLCLISGDTSLTAFGGLLFMIGLVLVAPALVKPIAGVFSSLISIAFAREGIGTLAQGNLTRQPTRSAITASATMIGLAIIVGLGGMIWSITGNFMNMLEKSLGSDYLLLPPSVAVWGSDVGAKQELANGLRSINGVEVVSTMRYAAASVNGKPLSLLGIDPEEFPKVSGLSFIKGDSKTAYSELASERSLIANGVFAAQTNLKVGDTVRLSTPTGEKPYKIAAIASDYLNAKILTAYISQENLSTDFRKNEDVFIQVNLRSNANVDRVEEKMKSVLKDYPQFKLVSGKGYLEENKQIFNSIYVFYFGLLSVLAAPSLIALINTLAIGVIERTREIGMLRAIGSTQKQVRRMIVAESLLLAAIGTALGLLAGLYLGYVMVLGLSTGGFPVKYAFPYAGLLAAIAVGLIFGVLAAMLPARQAAKLEIIRAIRYE